MLNECRNYIIISFDLCQHIFFKFLIYIFIALVFSRLLLFSYDYLIDEKYNFYLQFQVLVVE